MNDRSQRDDARRRGALNATASNRQTANERSNDSRMRNLLDGQRQNVITAARKAIDARNKADGTHREDTQAYTARMIELEKALHDLDASLALAGVTR